MHTACLILGILCIFIVLLDAFETIILPRRATGRFRLTRIFYRVTWGPWRAVTMWLGSPSRREAIFSFYGPLSLILLLVIWAVGIVVGFALIYFSLGSPLQDGLAETGFRTDLYLSGTTLFTLGLGDVLPRSGASRELVILEAGIGLGFLAVVMGYFPVLYGAFSRREVSISLLDPRAGSPPSATELLCRHGYEGGSAALTLLLAEWERWSAELLESHISYPLLCYFRSQHTNQSWLSALTAVLDTCALLIASVKGKPPRQAQLTFVMARHALLDLANVFDLKRRNDTSNRLTPESFAEMQRRLCEANITICTDLSSMERLGQIRALYESQAEALSEHLGMALPPWINHQARKDSWTIISNLRAQAEAGSTGDEAQSSTSSMFIWDGDNHDF
jgi:Ion channel